HGDRDHAPDGRRHAFEIQGDLARRPGRERGGVLTAAAPAAARRHPAPPCPAPQPAPWRTTPMLAHTTSRVPRIWAPVMAWPRMIQPDSAPMAGSRLSSTPKAAAVRYRRAVISST